MKVEKKQFQCQESMHPFEFSYQKEGIKCIRVDVVRGRGKMDFAKMFKKYWGKRKSHWSLRFHVMQYLLYKCFLTILYVSSLSVKLHRNLHPVLLFRAPLSRECELNHSSGNQSLVMPQRQIHGVFFFIF